MQLTLSSDPRMWMGGGIPTRWRRHGRDGRDRRDRRDRRLSFQIACFYMCLYSQKSSFLNTFSLTCNTGLGLGGLQKCLCWLTYNTVLGWGGWQKGGKSACFGLLAMKGWATGGAQKHAFVYKDNEAVVRRTAQGDGQKHARV